MDKGKSGQGMSPKNSLQEQGSLPLPVGREVDEQARKMLNQVLEEGEAALQITAPYGAEKVSANQSKQAQFSRIDERSVDYAIRDMEDDVEDLKLVVNSPGGRVDSANKIARSIDNNFKNIEAYVPHFAKSGGTLVSLSGDEIVMGEMSDLGPLDPQTGNQRGERYSTTDLQDAYQRWLGEWENTHPSEASAPEKSMMERMDILEFEKASKLTQTMEHYAANLLSQKDEVNEKQAQQTAQDLVRSYPIHGYTLTQGEAEEVLPEGMITSETEKQEEMDTMRNWMDQYAFDNSSSHLIVYHEN